MINITIIEGSTSIGSLQLTDIVNGVRYLLPDDLLNEFDEATEDEQVEIFDDIYFYLNDIAPDDLVFGMHDDDGADMGFWHTDIFEN